MTQHLMGAATSLLGAFVGGMFSIAASRRAELRDRDKERRLAEREIQNLLDAIEVELEALWGFHYRRLGSLLETMPDDALIELYYPITNDYFTIYNSNAVMIGRIRDGALRAAIVVVYNKCKKVAQTFAYNNALFTEYQELRFHPADYPNIEARLASKRGEMLAVARVIRADHVELRQMIETVLRLLKERHPASD